MTHNSMVQHANDFDNSVFLNAIKGVRIHASIIISVSYIHILSFFNIIPQGTSYSNNPEFLKVFHYFIVEVRACNSCVTRAQDLMFTPGKLESSWILVYSVLCVR